MEIIAAQPSGDIHPFANGVKARHLGRFHRAGRKFCCADAACGDFCLGIAFGAIGMKIPPGQLLFHLPQQGVLHIHQRDQAPIGILPAQPLCQRQREAIGQASGHRPFERGLGLIPLELAQPIGIGIGRKVDPHRIPMPPIR